MQAASKPGQQRRLQATGHDHFAAIAVLLYMDWKFTLVTLVLFPSCIVPIQIFGKRARKAVQNQQEDLGQMVVTMQETFAGIRVVKSFAREEHQEKVFRRSTMLQFRNIMRMVKSTEADGAVGRNPRRLWRWSGPALRLCRQPYRRRVSSPSSAEFSSSTIRSKP